MRMFSDHHDDHKTARPKHHSKLTPSLEVTKVRLIKTMTTKLGKAFDVT